MANNIQNKLRYFFRYSVVGSYNELLRLIYCRPMALSQKSAMVFAPHPDDETLGCGGMLALKGEQGSPVSVVFLTDGQGSHRNHPRITPDQLKSIRHQEAVEALTILGVSLKHIHFLGRIDGHLPNLSQTEYQETVDQIVHLLCTFRPQEAYVPYRHDCNQDHEAAYLLVQAAISRAGLAIDVLQYPIWSKWYPWRFDLRSSELANAHRLPIGRVLDRKTRAFQSYRSQYMPLPPDSESSLPPYFVNLFLKSNEIFFKT